MKGRSRTGEMVKVKVGKQISIIFSFIQTVYRKQQNNVLGCFYSLKFGKNLFSNNLVHKGIICTVEKVQINYFVLN